jgi:hypothetical protein
MTFSGVVAPNMATVGADVGPRGPWGGGRTEGPAPRREAAAGPVGDMGGQSFRYQRSSPPRTRPRVTRAGASDPPGAPFESNRDKR